MPSQASWSRSSSGSAGRRIRAELRACIPRSDVQLPDLEDAEFSASICAGDNFSVAALTRSPSCSGFEALAIGAVTLGRAIKRLLTLTLLERLQRQSRYVPDQSLLR